MSAPMRDSSLANMKRFSNTFSVMTQLPLARARRHMTCACMSVGKPGKGSVWMSVGHERPLAPDPAPAAHALDRGAHLLELPEHEAEVGGVKARAR